jgi:hypothetical protein
MQDLFPRNAKPTNKLLTWWTLDFYDLRAEMRKRFKIDIPVPHRDEWESFFDVERKKLEKLSCEITELEAEIDQTVYKLFGLTGDEIKLLEGSLEGQF